MVGAQVSKRTHHKQTTLGAVSDIKKKLGQKLVTPTLGKQRQAGSWGSLATTPILAKSWANEIPHLKKIPPAVDGHEHRDPQLGSVRE